MKLLLPFVSLIMIILLEGCGDHMIKNESKETQAAKTKDPVFQAVVPNADTNLTILSEKDIIGYWVGLFEPDTAIEPIYTAGATAWDYKNKINISIDSIFGDSVIGHSVVAGNYRPFSGVIKRAKANFSFSVKEPGDNKYDGAFSFQISTGTDTLHGKWTANNKLKISTRKYALTKTFFHYNPTLKLNIEEGEEYIDWTKKKKRIHHQNDDDSYDESFFTTSNDVFKYNASVDTLTKEQVSNLKKADIFIIRNSIYARHGYSFKNEQVRAFFDRIDWYVPVSTNVKSQLTTIEKQNIELLMRYEKNAKEYYDVFGRG